MVYSKVSVVIPFYNCEEYVDSILEYLYSQTLKDIEIICVDDGSIDNTKTILEEHAQKDSRIRLFSVEHKGAGAARNKGLHAATGTYIMFLDADDYFLPTYIEEMYNAIDSHDADVALCWAQQENVETKKCQHKFGFDPVYIKPNRPVAPSEIHNLFINIIPHPYNKIWRRNSVLKQGIDFSNTYAYNDQFFTYTSIVSARSIVAIDKELYTYRLHHNPDSISSNRARHVNDVLRIEKEIYDWLKEKGLLEKYLDTYMCLWRRSLRGASMIAEDPSFIDAVVHTLLEEEPWNTLKGKKLQREAGLQTVIAHLKLWRSNKGIKAKKEPSAYDIFLNSQAEREIKNINEIIRRLRLRDKKINYRVSPLRVGAWIIRDRGVHGVVSAAYRVMLKRR